MQKGTTSPGPENSAPTRGSPRRALWLLLAVLVAVGSTWVARRQEPPANPYAPSTWQERWLRPHQRNAFARAPVIQSELNAVFALPGSEKVWIVGSGGMLLRSDDGGTTWEKGEVYVPNDPPWVHREDGTRAAAPSRVRPELGGNGLIRATLATLGPTRLMAQGEVPAPADRVPGSTAGSLADSLFPDSGSAPTIIVGNARLNFTASVNDVFFTEHG